MDLLTLIAMCAPGVDPSTLEAIVTVESRGQVYAIRDNRTGRSHWPKNKAAAVRLAQDLYEQGHSLDVGLGQISTGNFEWLGLDFEGAFDPCINLAAVEKILLADYRRSPEAALPQQRLTQTLSRYNTGSPTQGVNNGYVARVVKTGQTMVPPLSVLFDHSVPDAALPTLQEHPYVFDSIPDGFE